MFHFTGENKVVMLNPGRRKRFITHEGPLKKSSIGNNLFWIIESTLERINGGDAKFEKIGDTLPEFSAIN
jgi:hypothetical protein